MQPELIVESKHDYTYVINMKSHMRIGFALSDVGVGRGGFWWVRVPQYHAAGVVPIRTSIC